MLLQQKFKQIGDDVLQKLEEKLDDFSKRMEEPKECIEREVAKLYKNFLLFDKSENVLNQFLIQKEQDMVMDKNKLKLLELQMQDCKSTL